MSFLRFKFCFMAFAFLVGFITGIILSFFQSFSVSAAIPQQGMRVVGERTLNDVYGKPMEYWVVHNSPDGSSLWGVHMVGGIASYNNFGGVMTYPWYGGMLPMEGATGAYNFNGNFYFDNDFIVAITPTYIPDTTVGDVKFVLTNKASALGQVSTSHNFFGDTYGEIAVEGVEDSFGRINLSGPFLRIVQIYSLMSLVLKYGKHILLLLEQKFCCVLHIIG